MLPKDFIAQLTTPAQSVAQISKVPASVTIAQAALESGWSLSAPGFNLFGIKATPDWKGAVVVEHTHEIINGVNTPITAQFRAYKTWLGSLQDHAQFLLTNKRYKPCFATNNALDFCKQLQACGYSTNPNYAKTLIEIIQSHNLLALDK
jgi:flagellum-specific peptidoglycan hydrolase FlgJ